MYLNLQNPFRSAGFSYRSTSHNGFSFRFLRRVCFENGFFRALLPLFICLSLLLTACGKKSELPDLIRLNETDDETGIPASWTYEGETFTFGITNGGYGFSCDDIWVEHSDELKGSPIYDATVERNFRLQDKYACDIATVYSGEGVSGYRFVVNAVNAGDDLFDAVCVVGREAFILATEGYLQDIMTNSYFDLSQPIWDQNFIDSMTINGHLYFLLGEYTHADNEATHAMIFNKDMLKQYDALPTADELYQLVRDGKWTLDRLLDYAGLVRADVDGDGSYTSKDRYGIELSGDSAIAFLQGCGFLLAERDDKSELGAKYNGYNEKIDAVWRRLLEAESYYHARNRTVDFIHESNPSPMHQSLQENRLLFCECFISQIDELRQYPVNFGILPIPKLSEEQDNYVCAAYEYGTMFLCLPLTNLDPEGTAYVLTAFSWEGKNLITPAFYDITLKGRVIKDPESADMLDIIFASKSYDLGTFANWAYSSQRIIRAWNEKIFNIASVYAYSKNRAEQVMYDTLTAAPYQNLLSP